MSAVTQAVNAASAVPDAVLKPAATAKRHPYVVIGVFVALTIVLMLIMEARRPGWIRMQVAKVPFFGPKIVTGRW